MTRIEARERLIHLHYGHILSNKQLLLWLKLDPTLTCWQKKNPPFWPSQLKLSSKQQNQLQNYKPTLQDHSFTNLLLSQHISIITILDSDYPLQLSQIYDPPVVLYLKGDIEKLFSSYCLGIVGARKADSYTAECLRVIIPPLISCEICVISGMAAGADGLAHRLAMGGSTIGVLGGGFDHPYPAVNRDLYHQMIKKQLLLTEYPPYLAPAKHFFPMRNRIIAGLSKGILVTQAAIRSGSMITVDRALEEGRDVFAIPGPINHELSQGTNHLIRQGASLVTSANDITEEWGMGVISSSTI